MTARRRLRVCVHGVVQGVGFRPFVYTTRRRPRPVRLGTQRQLRRHRRGRGRPPQTRRLPRAAASTDPPPLAVIESIETQDIPPVGGTGFAIADTSRSDGGRTLASPDVAMCADCAAEQRDPANRRYRHAFINCTNCGPRFTIIAVAALRPRLHHDGGFPMCAECAREYADPADRRFHAQPVCCPNCGPTLQLPRRRRWPRPTARPRCARARRLLRDGGILAVKGIGGYHLACDAGNEAAVAELRRRKRRGDKPFAVMVPDLANGVRDRRRRRRRRRGCSPARSDRSCWCPAVATRRIADAVAPHNPDLGVMLAYTPLHALLFGLPGDDRGPPVLVMTSGNLGGEPICFTDDDALERLSHLADGWLMHDRAILVPCDDSVVRVVDGVELPIRRSRGYAPLPIALAGAGAADAGGRRRPEEHAGGRRRQIRLAEPAHRRHGRPRDAVRVRRRTSGTCRS